MDQKQKINEMPLNWAAGQSPDTRMAQRASGEMGSALDDFVNSQATTPESQNFVNNWNNQRQLYGKLMDFYKKPAPRGKISTSLYNELEAGNFGNYLKKFMPKQGESDYKLGRLQGLVDDPSAHQDFQDASTTSRISSNKTVKPSRFLRALTLGGVLGAALHGGHGFEGSSLGMLGGAASEPFLENALMKAISSRYSGQGASKKLANFGLSNLLSKIPTPSAHQVGTLATGTILPSIYQNASAS